MTWAARNHHPGAQPPQPQATPPVEASARQQWDEAVWLWNDYVRKLRRHEMAVSLDMMLRHRELTGIWTAGDSIIANVAASFLDGTILGLVEERRELTPRWWPL